MATDQQPAVEDFPHRLLWFAQRAEAVLDDVLDHDGGLHVLDLAAEPTAVAVAAFSKLASRMQAIATTLLAHADDVDVAAGATPVATSTGAWLAGATRTPVGLAHRQVKLSRRLEVAYVATRDAALAGDLDPAQVEVIVHALDGLPWWVDGDQRARAEKHLLGLADRHDAKTLKLLARHLVEVLDPEGADIELARRLAKEEADAAKKTIFTMVDDGHGLCHGKFRIPALHGAMLGTALNALANPRRPDAIAREVVDPDDPAGQRTDRRSATEILGDAFVELIDRFPAKKLPQTGGGLATVLVTIPLEVLQGRLGVATLSTGGQITEGAARRLACHHGLIPQVLGSKSEPLEQGRKVRLHTESQRIAMAARDKTCTAEGCTIPASWCHAHHLTPWSHGGKTSVKDGRMVCSRHHTLIHHNDYAVTLLANGKIRLTRRRRQ